MYFVMCFLLACNCNMYLLFSVSYLRSGRYTHLIYEPRSCDPGCSARSTPSRGRSGTPCRIPRRHPRMGWEPYAHLTHLSMCVIHMYICIKHIYIYIYTIIYIYICISQANANITNMLTILPLCERGAASTLAGLNILVRFALVCDMYTYLSLSLYIYIYIYILHMYICITHIDRCVRCATLAGLPESERPKTGSYGRFSKFHRVFSGRDPGTLKSDIVSNKSPQLICSDLRLSN